MRGYAPRCTHGRVGRTTKSTLKEQRQTPIYLGWTHCTKGRQWAITDATEWLVITARWKNTNLFSLQFFFFFSAQSGPRPPQRACCTDKTLLLHEWASFICTSYISVSEAARQPMHSNYLQSCLRTPNSHTFKFKRLYWQWKGGVGGRIQQKHRGASVGAGNAIIQLMMTLNGTIMAPW